MNEKLFATVDLTQRLIDLKERFEAMKNGNAGEQDVYRENGRFYGMICQYINLFADELEELMQKEVSG